MYPARAEKLAAKIGRKSEELAPTVLRILDETAPDTGVVTGDVRSMSANPEVTLKVVEDFFILFCKGMQIAFERYGYCPDNFMFNKEFRSPDGNLRYDVSYDKKSDTVFVKLAAVEEFYKKRKLNDTIRHTLMGDLPVAAEEHALLGGFEEGWHSCENKDPVLHAEIAKKQAIIDSQPIMVSPFTSDSEFEYAQKADEVYVAGLKRLLIREMRENNLEATSSIRQ